MIITNTLYRLPDRRPSDREDNIVTNEIDLILINERYHNSIKSEQMYPSTMNPLVAKIRLKICKPNRPRKIDTMRLKEKGTYEEIQRRIHRNLDTRNNKIQDINEQWQSIK